MLPHIPLNKNLQRNHKSADLTSNIKTLIKTKNSTPHQNFLQNPQNNERIKYFA